MNWIELNGRDRRLISTYQLISEINLVLFSISSPLPNADGCCRELWMRSAKAGAKENVKTLVISSVWKCVNWFPSYDAATSDQTMTQSISFRLRSSAARPLLFLPFAKRRTRWVPGTFELLGCRSFRAGHSQLHFIHTTHQNQTISASRARSFILNEI